MFDFRKVKPEFFLKIAPKTQNLLLHCAIRWSTTGSFFISKRRSRSCTGESEQRNVPMPVLGTQKMAGFRRLDIPIFGVLTLFDFPHFSQKLGALPASRYVAARRCPWVQRGRFRARNPPTRPERSLGLSSRHVTGVDLRNPQLPTDHQRWLVF